MKKAITVLGPVDPEELGFTSMHEHVSFQGAVLARRLRAQVPETILPVRENDAVCLENVGILLKNSIMAWDALIQDDEEVMAGECEDYKATGGDSMVEVSVPGIQLDTAMIKRISERAGVHIIASTGFYTWDSWPERFLNLGVSDYKRHMAEEIRYGISGTDVKPGSLKIALEDLNQMEENALRAAAQLCGETNLPLTIHPCSKPGGNRLQVVEILKEEGVDLGRVVFAHTSVQERPASYNDLIYHPELLKMNTDMAERIMSQGANCCFEFCNPLGFEMMHRPKYGDYLQMAGIVRLLEAGWAKQMVLGNDVCGRTMLRRGGALGYMRLTSFVIPSLREAGGIKESDIRQMMVLNPARIMAVDY
ncbi:MAG: phosphotriesterase [Clostridiales bacterium]|jgi:phosphotriesterase-related protein|nr:phosphotriesterase [Clostridiales bacterium]